MNNLGTEGLRTRKRRQTRERIVNSALNLFLKHGFDAVTIDEIATAADISKRSFFDYFPSKEEVVFAWQDAFGEALAAAIAARPAGEPLPQAAEAAFTGALAAASHPHSLAIEALIRSTPALAQRDSAKYARLEQTLAEALIARTRGERGRFRARLLAAILIAGLKLGNEEWQRAGQANPAKVRAFTRKIFRKIWTELEELARTAKPE